MAEKFALTSRQKTKDRGTFFRFIEHLHPHKVPSGALRLSSTWALGGISLVLCCLLALSGLLLLLIYKPFPEMAYESVLHLENRILFGPLVRNVHYFSANLLVFIVFLHLLRVVFTQGYRGKRKVNWVVGLLLFVLILAACFTGYLLPWDQLAYWAVTVSIHILDYVPAGPWLKQYLLSGNELSAGTLQLFYTLHTFILPALLVIFLSIHFWKVRQCKGVVTPVEQGIEGRSSTASGMVNAMPQLFLRELTVGLIVVALVLALSVFFRAPLEQMANAGLSPNPAKSPWYFSGLQELLLHFPPFIGAFVMPVVAGLFLLCLPLIPAEDVGTGIWFISNKGKYSVPAAFLMGSLFTVGLILLSEYSSKTEVMADGLLPLVVVLVLFAFSVLGGKKVMQLNRIETLQVVFSLLVSSFLVLTAIGAWFRGENMTLSWFL